MKTLGVLIRKKGEEYSPTKENLKKQLLTLHKKLKKEGTTVMEYSIESDTYDKKNYHIHCIIPIENNENQIRDRLSKYIKGTHWDKRIEGYKVYDVCEGEFGRIDLQYLIDVHSHRQYINKYDCSTTLI